MSKLDGLIAWYENLSPETVVEAGRFYASDASFKDPFNEVRGIAAIERIFRDTRGGMIPEGTTEIQTLIIGREVLGISAFQ